VVETVVGGGFWPTTVSSLSYSGEETGVPSLPLPPVGRRGRRQWSWSPKRKWSMPFLVCGLWMKSENLKSEKGDEIDR
jgi:hypothetical protein